MTRRVCWTLAIGAVVVAGFVYAILRTPSEQPFHDYVAAMRAAGEPTTYEELAGPMPPDEENAAPEIDAALKAVEAELGNSAMWAAGAAPGAGLCEADRSELTEAQSRRAADFGDALAKFTDETAAALRRPRCRFSTIVQRDGSPDDSHLDRVRNVILLLQTRARFARDPAAQLAACELLGQFADRLEPVTARETEMACRALRACVVSLREGLVDGGWEPKATRERMDALLVRPWVPRVAGVLRFGAIWWQQAYAAMLDGRRPTDLERLGLTVAVWTEAKRTTDHLTGKRTWGAFERGSAGEIVAVCSLFRAGTALPTTSFPVFRDQYHALVRAADLDSRSEPHQPCGEADGLAAADGRARLARVAMALAEFRVTHGDFPAALDELRAAFPEGVPADPYTDAHFMYERTTGGVRVWSRTFVDRDSSATFDEAATYALAWELRR